MENSKYRDYTHHELDKECTAIGGHFVTIKEVRLPYHGKEVFYTIGHAIVDTSCCGTSGCGFAAVYGNIVDWKYGKSDDGLPMTRVEPVRNKKRQDELKVLINDRETINQVNFINT